MADFIVVCQLSGLNVRIKYRILSLSANPPA